MNNQRRRNLFKLEEEEFDIIEKEKIPIIKSQKSTKEIDLYLVKPDKNKSKKIKATRNPKNFPVPNKFQIKNLEEKITLSAENYPGEIVVHQEHYFISLQEDGQFSWFLLK